MDIQSDSGPAVARPMKVPIRSAKLKNPMNELALCKYKLKWKSYQ